LYDSLGEELDQLIEDFKDQDAEHIFKKFKWSDRGLVLHLSLRWSILKNYNNMILIKIKKLRNKLQKIGSWND